MTQAEVKTDKTWHGKKGSGCLVETQLMTVIITEEAQFIVSISSQHKGRMKDLKREPFSFSPECVQGCKMKGRETHRIESAASEPLET